VVANVQAHPLSNCRPADLLAEPIEALTPRRREAMALVPLTSRILTSPDSRASRPTQGRRDRTRDDLGRLGFLDNEEEISP
jgi:hypothetical protein